MGTSWTALPAPPVNIWFWGDSNSLGSQLIITTDGTVYGSFFTPLDQASPDEFTYSIDRLAADGKTWQAIPVPKPDVMRGDPPGDIPPGVLVISEDRAGHPNALWLLLQQMLSYHAA
jgi:hypothetical protein